MKKIIFLILLAIILTGCVIKNNNLNETEKNNIDNTKNTTTSTKSEKCIHRGCEPNINANECSDLNGEVITTQSGYCDTKENFLGTITDVLCPCICCKK